MHTLHELWNSNVARNIYSSGYALVPGILSHKECDTAAEALMDISDKRSKAGARHLMSIPAVNSLANDPRLVDLASSVLGEAATPYRATLFDKSPQANWLVTWHQDTALPLRSRFDLPGWGPWSVKSDILYAHAPAWALEKIVALRIHFDDCGSENGPLRVIPGSHRKLTNPLIFIAVKRDQRRV